MCYFSSRRFVHRDLASRNCLVRDQTLDGSGEQLIVKIADFGLARSLDPILLTYEGKDCEAIPVRWLPFESIVYSLFSSASDVWSFGVLLWEIFSFARLPYADLTHDEVVRYLSSENVLSIPENTSNDIYDIMLQCWQTKPELRPTFEFLCEQLERLECEAKRRTMSSNSTDRI
jgi:serine/threonine protein kinase